MLMTCGVHHLREGVRDVPSQDDGDRLAREDDGLPQAAQGSPDSLVSLAVNYCCDVRLVSGLLSRCPMRAQGALRHDGVPLPWCVSAPSPCEALAVFTGSDDG